MKRIRPVVAAALAAFAAGCAGTDGDEWQGTVRDSAGVAIVENPAQGMWSADERPAITEALRIGETEGGRAELQFGTIAGLDIDSQGNIHVLDQQASKIRVFGPDGSYLREMGGPGSGPGELSPAAVGLIITPGDTVVVPDPAQARLTRYAPDGEPLGSTPLNMAQGIPMRWDVMPDRRMVSQVRMMPMPGSQPPAGGQPAEMHDWLLLRAPDGTVTDTVLELPAGQTFQFQQGGGARIRIFEPEPIWAIDSEGRIIYGINSDYRLRMHDEQGELQRIVTLPFELRPVTETDQDAFRRFIQEAWANAGVPPAAMDQLLAGLSFGDNYPAFANIIGGPNGTIWVQHVKTAQDVADEGGEFSAQDVGASDFDVFDAEGRFMGVLALPDRFQPLRVSGDRIYGVWRDELDVQHVMVLEFDGGEENES